MDFNDWLNKRDGLPKPRRNERDVGYTVGGPVGRPGGSNRWFFFWSQQRGYGDIMMVEQTAHSRYNSLRLSLDRPYVRGLSCGVNCNPGKAMGTSSADLPAARSLGAPRNDGSQKAANYMPLDFDRRHTFVANFVCNATLNVASLTNPTPTNLARDAGGKLIPADNRGFGAVTAVAPPRQMQLLARFTF